ncbi:hypothetical protein BJ138DRAFT_976209, partial [Hygrophoropsis aurantiaca]
DYYSCTMLTLFAPWRSGRDLRDENTTWTERFQAYAFSDRQREIMKFFNVRYECLDARDDYSAQMREDNSKHDFSAWDNDNYPGEHEEEIVEHDMVFPRSESDQIMDDTIGTLTSKWNYDKAAVEQTLLTSGWL